MKHFFSKVKSLLLFVAAMSFFAGCEDENNGIGAFSLSVKEIGADYVDIFVTAPEPLTMYYIVSDEEQLVTAAVLKATGTSVDVNPGQVLRLDKDIVQNTHYYLYAVGVVNDDFTGKISLDFTTKNYEFDEVLTIVDTYYDGFKVHVAVPQDVKDAGHVLRYGYINLATYNKTVMQYGTIDVERLIQNGNIGGRYIKNDSTLVYDKYNLYEEVEGEELDIHDDIFPNEPGIFMVGEFRWGASKEEIEQEIGISGWYPSYIIPMYDWQSGEWTGVFEKKEFKAKAPDELDAEFEVDVYDITPLDAVIEFNPDDNVYQYIYMIMDDNVYNTMLNLVGGEENIQWFIASTNGYFEGATLGMGHDVINAMSMFTEPLAKDTRYRILINAWGDKDGTSQKFIVKEFRTKAATKPRPVIEVTAVETGDPYLATFNIKAGKDKDGNIQPITGAYYGVNYAREFQLLFNRDATYESILKGNYSFTNEELMQINSKDGLNYSVYTLDGEVTRMAVYGCNDEYTFNVVDPSDQEIAAGIARGWADYVAPYATGKGPASAYASVADRISGVWTASAKLQAKQLVDKENQIYEKYEITHKSRVEIGRSMPELPAVLPDSVYTIYSGSTTDEVAGMYEELQMLSDMFEDSRLESQSRLLCSGFMDFDYYSNPGRLDWRSPYSLFTARNYVSVDVAQLIYDFGPKWFMEVREDGSVIVPFNSMFLPPMHNWPGYPFYVGGVDGDICVYDSNEKYPGFPVEIVNDDKIVIKPIEFDGNVLYMNALGFGADAVYGQLEIVAPIISEITLTRGWDGADGNVKAAPVRTSATAVNFDGTPVKTPVVRKVRSMTDLESVDYEVVDKVTIVTEENLDAYMTKQVEKFMGKLIDNE